MGQANEVRIPDIGDYKGVPVIEILVRDGDEVAKDATLLVLESDKATLEVPSPGAGVVAGLRLKVGDKVSQGDLICELSGAASVATPPVAETAAAAPATRQEQAPPAPTPAPPSPKAPAAQSPAPTRDQAPQPASGNNPYAGPATRKLARELGVALDGIYGSGPRGRIVVDDVKTYVKAALGSASPAASQSPSQAHAGIPPIPAVDFSQWGPIEHKPLARIRRISAAHLHRAWLNVPHVTQFDEADITELEAFRKAQSEELGVKLTLLAFVMKAVAHALRVYPEFNASLAPDAENLILKGYCNIGFAADTENGLVVPVVRDVWSKGVVAIANDCAALAKRARDSQLKADDMKGGCFSISSLGGIGGSHFTPIVNAPEVAILGVSRAQMKPTWDGREFVPRLICPLSLSYDHRVIDGANAARFITLLAKLLADLRRLVI